MKISFYEILRTKQYKLLRIIGVLIRCCLAVSVPIQCTQGLKCSLSQSGFPWDAEFWPKPHTSSYIGRHQFLSLRDSHNNHKLNPPTHALLSGTTSAPNSSAVHSIAVHCSLVTGVWCNVTWHWIRLCYTIADMFYHVLKQLVGHEAKGSTDLIDFGAKAGIL